MAPIESTTCGTPTALLMEGLAAERPDGPLAVTHRRRGADCRYHAIYVSPEFDVLDVEHLWEGATEAGSDHAAVLAQLEWTAVN
jgi:endonuclease/exonuclease/phosphatase family metal-dependent hydrolase